MKRYLFWTLWALLINSIFGQDPNFHIYLCFGQSNMAGAGDIETQDKTVDSRFQFMKPQDCSSFGQLAGNWYKAVPPLWGCTGGIGPADYFGRTMVSSLASPIKIGVVVVAIPGCKIELFGKTGYQGLDTYNNVPSKYAGSAYAWLLDLAKKAQQTGVIKGFLLHQGESNSGDQQWPNKVKGVYDNLVKDLGLNAANTPLLAGELLYQNSCCSGHNPIINKLPSVLPNSYVISASGLQGKDVYHFNSAGVRIFGQRYAEKMLTLYPKGTQAPFRQILIQIPGRIEAEDFDSGGEGLAFHEIDASGNQGGATYRTDQVDIEATSDIGGGYNLAYIRNGEWVEYSVNVSSSGVYDLYLRVASDGAAKTLHVEIGDVNITGAVTVPNTGGWQTWQTVTVKNLDLSAGQKIMRIAFDADYMNFNYMEFKKATITDLDQEHMAAALSVFPNPFTEDILIKSNGTFRYQLFSMEGQKLEAGTAIDQHAVGSALGKGMYLLKVEMGTQQKSIKLLKR